LPQRRRALLALIVILAFVLRGQNYDTLGLLQMTAVGVANGGLATSLAVAGFFLLGNLFGITTSVQLMELARPTHPLLHELQMKAPGTYHHSILISNMAEQAAQAIGADALLARVGAYYHDIGKILRPYFFTENQMDGVNVHERLDPKTSAQIIISHVADGLELAKKYRLPRRIRDFIPQHHGTRLASFFCQSDPVLTSSLVPIPCRLHPLPTRCTLSQEFSFPPSFLKSLTPPP